MATQMIPEGTPTQQASARLHLSRRADWRIFHVNGVRYVALQSGNSGHVYQVRADATGCSCPAYTNGARVCSHMIAVRLANEQAARPKRDALALMADLTDGCRARGCGEDREDGEPYCRQHQLVDAF